MNELQRLQDLILGEEKDRLHKLDHRVTDLELRTTDVAEVLPNAISRLVEDPVSKSEFEQPIVSSIRSAIKRDTHSFAEILFPVLGPAIRRAVADALKSLVQRINVALENSFTVKGIGWRIEAIRTGVPFAQIVLHHTMLYSVQETFLIQRKSGLVLASAQRDETLALDEDAVSAMLTAIQAFIQDSFGVPSDEPLRSAELGDRTLWVINGPDAVLACVISGSPPREVRDELMDLLETMHARFGDRFIEHPEMLSGHAGLSALMLETLREEADEQVRQSAGPRYKLLWILAGLVLLAWFFWSGWNLYRDNRLEEQVTSLFTAEPGYVVTAHEVEAGQVSLAGLRDPLAAEPAAVLQAASVPVDSVRASFRPYQSLGPEIMQRRLRATLGLGNDVTLGLQGTQLTVTGQLTSAQYAKLESLPEYHPVIQAVHLDAARLAADEAVALIRRQLAAPASVAILPSDGRMILSGAASAEWFAEVSGVADVGGWDLDFGPLKAGMEARLDELVELLDGRSVMFDRRTSIAEPSLAGLDALARDLLQAQSLAGALQSGFSVTLEGFTDGVDTAEKNRELAMGRAQRVVAELQSRGVETTGIELQQQAFWVSGSRDLDRRKVVLHVNRDKDR